MFEVVEFWIVNFTGAPLYWFSPNKTLDPDAKHNFIIKIIQHIKELENGAELIHEEHLGMFEIEGFNYYYLGTPRINSIFIAKSPRKFHPISIDFDLSMVERNFIYFFGKELEIIENDKSKEASFLENLKDKFENSFFKEYFKKRLQ